jgi:flagellar protein FliO/FliZ
MTLAVTSPSWANEGAAAESGTGLPVRPTKPLELAPQPASTGTTYKALAAVAVVAGAFFWVKKKHGAQTKADDAVSIRVLGRATIGMRSEIVIVEADGTRLLLGTTPSAIQTLAVLDAAPEAEAPAPAAEPKASTEPPPREVRPVTPIAASTIDDRVRALFAPSSDARPAKPTKRVRPVAGQARGLRDALEDEK